MAKSKGAGALTGRTWMSIILFGLIGQIAWMVENMYFSRFMQNEITRAPYATTLMVAFPQYLPHCQRLSAVHYATEQVSAKCLFAGVMLSGV